jgi:cell fate (sporulation/competence/biofilm development) regulator YlbF (YheA/YmcA/DUF963 family)
MSDAKIHPITTDASTDALLNEVEEFIAAGHTMLMEGEMPDLQGLDDKVRRLVQRIQQFSVEGFSQLQPRLNEVMEGLDQLKSSLQQQKVLVENRINELPGAQKAHNAYQKVQSDSEKAVAKQLKDEG